LQINFILKFRLIFMNANLHQQTQEISAEEQRIR